MNRTNIQWTNVTWNPMTGCTKLSSGCDHCYAHIVAERRTREVYLKHDPVKNTAANRSDPFAPRFWPDRLELPIKLKAPSMVFVNSMSDVFHAQFSVAQIGEVFEVMNACPQHQFQVLTKRPERAARLSANFAWTPNIWMGTSIENMKVARRADALRDVPSAIKFISAEPILGPLDELDVTGIDWIIGGGESGAGHRPCDPDWARGLRNLCVTRGIAFFWKQWGGYTPKAGGRLLDGIEWNEFPATPSDCLETV